MPWPQVWTDFETLFEPTRIWLFGKPFPTIEYKPDTMSGIGNMPGAGPDATHPGVISRDFPYQLLREACRPPLRFQPMVDPFPQPVTVFLDEFKEGLSNRCELISLHAN